jgi:RNA polymerase sigma-70 factor (ECF subfamily)
MLFCPGASDRPRSKAGVAATFATDDDNLTDVRSPDYILVGLLERIQRSGDAGAWREFVAVIEPMLYAWLRRLPAAPADASDLVQDVLLTLVEQLPRFNYDREKSFCGWLRTVMRNRCCAVNRRRQAEAWSPDDPRWRLLPPYQDPEPYWETESRQQVIARALKIMQSEFQPNTWKACWEHIVSGRSAADVAKQYGMTAGAVYVAKSRVLQRLRRELGTSTE